MNLLAVPRPWTSRVPMLVCLAEICVSLLPPAVAQCPPQWLPGDDFDLRGNAAPAAVYALAEMPNGDLVAGGEFTQAGGVAVANIARWDGNAWSPLGAGIQGGIVRALATLPNGDLVAGGDFTLAGGVAVNRIARWDGSSWSGLGNGVTGGPAAPYGVRALLTLPNGDLVVGGSFATAGTATAVANVARWNGASWFAMGAGISVPIPPFFTWTFPVNSLAKMPNGSVIAGTDVADSGNSGGRVASWDGSTWSFLFSGGNAFGSIIRSVVAMPNGDILAAGNGLAALGGAGVMRWNGSTWTNVGSLNLFSASTVHTLATLSNGDVVAGGTFSSLSGVAVANVARWDGVQWWPLAGGDTDGTVRDLEVLASGILVACGSFATAGGAESHRVARWGCDAGFARSDRFGAGCGWMASSFYEGFQAANSFDIASSTLQLSLTATGYDVVHIPGTPTFHNPASLPESLTDDSVSAPIPLPFAIPYPGGSTSQIVVGSNGFVYLEPSTNASPYYGSVSELLSEPPRHTAMWGDHDPAAPGTGAGTIHVDIVGSVAVYVTWLGVQQWNLPSVLRTFQIAMFANGDVQYRYLACSQDGAVLTGWSPGYGAQDPASRDISATSPFNTTSTEFMRPLQQSVNRRPRLGSSITLTTSHIPASGSVGATIIGLGQRYPGIDLRSIGMPGCYQFTSIHDAVFSGPNNGAVAHTFPIPVDTQLVGAHVYTQGLALVPGSNLLGVVTSNGIDLRIGIHL